MDIPQPHTVLTSPFPNLQVARISGLTPLSSDWLLDHPYQLYECQVQTVKPQQQGAIQEAYEELEGLVQLFGFEGAAELEGVHFFTFSGDGFLLKDIHRLLSDTEGGFHSKLARRIVKDCIKALSCFEVPDLRAYHPYIVYRIFSKLFESEGAIRRLQEDIKRFSNHPLTVEITGTRKSPRSPFRILSVSSDTRRRDYLLRPLAVPLIEVD